MPFHAFMQDLAQTRALAMRRAGAARIYELSVGQGPLVRVQLDAVLTDRPAQLSARLADLPQAPALRARVLGRVLDVNHARARAAGAALRPQAARGPARPRTDADAPQTEEIVLRKTLPPQRATQRQFVSELVRFARLAGFARAELWAVLPRPAGL